MGVTEAVASRQEIGDKVRRIADREIIFDKAGFFGDLHQWNEGTAEALAEEGTQHGSIELWNP